VRALRTTMRSHACGELREGDAGAEVTLCGWVAHRRDHGGVTFIDLRDREGVVQVVFHPDAAPDAHASAQRLGAEDVVRVTGSVQIRPEGMRNPALATGEVEVRVSDLEVLAEAETPPFLIEDRVDADELLRLQYRYLDLRRPQMTRMLRIRHRVVALIREELDARGFVEVETPMLFKSTPEGARDFLVPSRTWPGTFYALPQSPQQYKQLLMVGGQDRYYQIARCFRDEKPRADRAIEFTQLDLEMSFVTEEDIFELTETLFSRIFTEVGGIEIETPFPRMRFDEAIERYGSDKPDLRYGMQLVDLSDAFRESEFRVFANALVSGGVVKGLAAPGGGSLARKELDALEQDAKGRGAGGLVWLVVQEDGVRSPVEKYLAAAEIDDVCRETRAAPGDLVLLVADRPERVAVALDGARRDLAERLQLVPPDVLRFLWIVEPPLFEWGEEEEKWVSAHHPFTAPVSEDLDPGTARGRSYDIVLNGVELCGGSIRIHDPAVQRKVFSVLGLSDEEIEAKFGHLLRAFRYGVPPHGGIAPGIDRIAMLLLGTENIREVMAFPKAQSGNDPLTGAPAPVPEEQLRELGIKLEESVGEEPWNR
jgi:aspartyl-tRNA synthetase